MNILIEYDSSVSSAPAGFKMAVNAAVSYFDSLITTPITVPILFSYGELGGAALSSGALGESSPNGNIETYSTVKQLLTNVATSTADQQSVASLPASDPTSGNYFWVTDAQAQAFGLGSEPGYSDPEDGFVALGSGYEFTYDPNNRSVNGAYDAIGVLEHEISEVLGRISDLGVGTFTSGSSTLALYSVLDLFRYSSAGVRSLAQTSGYFSVNGETLLTEYNDPKNGGDAGDWASLTTSDAFNAFTGPDSELTISEADILEMDVVGFAVNSGATQEMVTTVSANTVSTGLTVSGDQALTILSGGSAVSITVSSGGFEFVHSGGSVSNSVVHSGGYEVISAGGTSINTTVSSGGTLELPSASGSGVLFAGVISAATSVSGATLQSGAILLSGGLASALGFDQGGVTVVPDATVDMLGNSVLNIYGSGGTVSAGSDDTFGVYGAGETADVIGSSDVVSVGGNGQGASDANVDNVVLSQAGTVNIIDGSRANVNGAGLTVTAGSSDSLGLIGSGDTVTAFGAGDDIWIGGDGQGASDANVDNVVLSQAGTVNIIDGSRANVNGAGLTVTAGASDSLGLIGSGDTVTAFGAGDDIWIGGDGQGASDANVDNVVLSQAGTVNIIDGSRANVNGAGLTVTAGSSDSLGLIGSGDTVTAFGAGDDIWIGGDGQGASDANVDNVVLSQAGTVNIIDGSRANVNGAGLTVTAGASDSLGLIGSGDTVTAFGAGDDIWIGGDGQGASDANVDNVVLSQAGTVNIIDGSRANVNGAGLTVTAGSSDSLGLIGSGDTVTAFGAGDDIWIGGDGQGASDANVDNVVLSQAGTVNIIDGSRANVNGAGLTVTAGASDSLGLIGSGDTVTVTGAGDALWINGAGAAINASSTLASTQIQAVGGGTTLNITGGGVSVLNAADSGLSAVVLSASSTAYSFMANAEVGLVVTDQSSTVDTIAAGGVGETLTGGVAGKLTLVGSTQGGDTFLDTSARINGDTIENYAASGDVIDLSDMTFSQLTTQTFTEDAAGTAGVLTLGDGTHSASVILLGQFMAAGFSGSATAAGFSTSFDGASGAKITYVAVPH